MLFTNVSQVFLAVLFTTWQQMFYFFPENMNNKFYCLFFTVVIKLLSEFAFSKIFFLLLLFIQGVITFHKSHIPKAFNVFPGALWLSITINYISTTYKLKFCVGWCVPAFEDCFPFCWKIFNYLLQCEGNLISDLSIVFQRFLFGTSRSAFEPFYWKTIRLYRLRKSPSNNTVDHKLFNIPTLICGYISLL